MQNFFNSVRLMTVLMSASGASCLQLLERLELRHGKRHAIRLWSEVTVCVVSGNDDVCEEVILLTPTAQTRQS